MDVEEGKAAGVDIAGEHPRLHHLHGLCHTIVHFASMHKVCFRVARLLLKIAFEFALGQVQGGLECMQCFCPSGSA